MRWAWIGLAIVSTVGYLWVNPLIAITLVQDGEEEDRAEPEKDNEVEGLEEDEDVDAEDVLVDTGAEDDGPTEPPPA